MRDNQARPQVDRPIFIDNPIRRIDIWRLEITLSEKRAPSTGGQSLGAQRFPATGKRSLCGRRCGDVRRMGRKRPRVSGQSHRPPPIPQCVACPMNGTRFAVPPYRPNADSDIWDWPTGGRPTIDIHDCLAVGRDAVLSNRFRFGRAPPTASRRHRSPLNEFCRRYEKRQDVNKT